MATSNIFDVCETTIADIHAAFQSGALTARQLVQIYLDRIEAYDQQGPAINALISINPTALDEADRLDEALKASGLIGPLHGIPIIMKDQGDIAKMPTTLGSVLFDGYMPNRDAFVVSRLKEAGAIFIGKATLGELGGGAGGSIHFCGNGEHLVESLLEIGPLRGLDFGQPDMMDVPELHRKALASKVAITQLHPSRDELVTGRAAGQYPTGVVFVYNCTDIDDARQVVDAYAGRA